MAKAPTRAQRAYWSAIAELGCIVGPGGCGGRITIHHCGTGGGGRKNHDKVIGLCWNHHLGPDGIDGKQMSKREWQVHFGSEESLMERVKERLGV